MLAGRDDMQMCELSLDETGLTRKRGAEILGNLQSRAIRGALASDIEMSSKSQLTMSSLSENEFDKEWTTHGGSHYTRPADRKKNGRA